MIRSTSQLTPFQWHSVFNKPSKQHDFVSETSSAESWDTGESEHSSETSTDCDSDPSPRRVTFQTDGNNNIVAKVYRYPTISANPRHVRFQTDGNNNIVAEVYRYAAVSARLKKKCFLNSEQILAKKRAARAYCDFYAMVHPEYIESVSCVFDSQSASSREQLAEKERTETEAVVVLAVSNARGLEKTLPRSLHLTSNTLSKKRCLSSAS
jgi:hypothetical protein